MSRKHKIGFMQGRFSPLINGSIQAFPWPYWSDEFMLAERNRFHIMEWTLDHDRLYENPVMNVKGQKTIRSLIETHDITIPSLTGDCFMEAPFYKVSGEIKDSLLTDLKNVIEASAVVGIRNILIPLVDGGRLENEQQENILLQGLSDLMPIIKRSKVSISFESDFPPEQLFAFINKLDDKYFGITYDIGNSAAKGYISKEEIDLYGHRIINVHVKDRVLGGGTVPLGKGDADIFGVFQSLYKKGYKGNYILQTARAADEKHEEVLCGYRDMVSDWLDAVEK